MPDIFRQYKARNGDDGGPRSGFIALVASMVLHIGAVAVFIALSSPPVNHVQTGEVIFFEFEGQGEDGASQQEQQARLEQERQAQLQQEQQARLEQERQAQLQQEQQARLEQERQVQLQQEQQARLEQERQAQLQQEQQARLEQEQQAQLQQEQQARLEQERQAKLEQEQQARLEQERQAKLEQEQQARLEQERQAQLQQEQQARLEQERQAQLEQEHQAKLEQERQAKLEQERQAKLEQERQTKLEQERQAKLEQERQAKLERERQAKLERERQAKLEQEQQALDRGVDDAVAAIAKKLQGGGGTGGPTEGEQGDKEKAKYYGAIRDIISRNWLAPADASSIDLVATYEIVIQPGGQVSLSLLVKSSGSESYDLSVARALRNSSPLPPLPAVFSGETLTLKLNFSLDELRRGV